MPVQFKLTASVGKMGANKLVDVKIVQCCLAAIKLKSKPYYAGRIDGKFGPKTLFQCATA